MLFRERAHRSATLTIRFKPRPVSLLFIGRMFYVALPLVPKLSAFHLSKKQSETIQLLNLSSWS